jgi:hypothetical protein
MTVANMIDWEAKKPLKMERREEIEDLPIGETEFDNGESTWPSSELYKSQK